MPPQVGIDWLQHAGAIIDSVVASVLYVVLRLHKEILRAVKSLWHACTVLLSKRRSVLIWNDVNPIYSAKIATHLEASFPEFKFVVIEQLTELFEYLLHPTTISGLILIDSDVTKFSANPKISRQIERVLIRYLMRGGGIVGTHDIIYSRVRNEQLQVAFGGTVANFTRTQKPIQYIRTEQGKTHPMTAHLPDRFELDDREIVWGEWQKDCVIHYESDLEPSTALLVSRTYWNGRLVWANSGDHGKTLADSIAQPQPAFLEILVQAVHWVTRHREAVDKMTKQIVAHRGVAIRAHENTAEAFEEAIRCGCEYAELDVRLSKDGVYVVHHEPDVAGSLIRDFNWEELRAMADTAGYKLARFDEVLELAKGRIKLDIELKETGYETEVLQTITKVLGERDFVITSFNDSSLKRIKQVFPRIRCGLLLGIDKPRHSIRTRLSELFPERRLDRIGADFVVPNYKLIRFGFSRRMQSRGCPIWVWTVDEPRLIKWLLGKTSVEAIITDTAELAMSLRSKVHR